MFEREGLLILNKKKRVILTILRNILKEKKYRLGLNVWASEIKIKRAVSVLLGQITGFPDKMELSYYYYGMN